MAKREIVLREERSSEGSRFLAAEIAENGDLTIKGQDLGRGVEAVWGHGNSEYEWFITVRAAHVPRLVAALGGAPGDDALELLSVRHREDERYASLSFFQQGGIPAEFANRVGD